MSVMPELWSDMRGSKAAGRAGAGARAGAGETTGGSGGGRSSSGGFVSSSPGLGGAGLQAC